MNGSGVVDLLRLPGGVTGARYAVALDLPALALGELSLAAKPPATPCRAGPKPWARSSG
jgi:hypothetical protein